MTASAESPNEETPSLARADMMGDYLGQFNKMFDEEKEPKQFAILFANRIGSRYFLANLKTMHEIDRLCREMDSVLDEFPGKNFGLIKLLTIEHLAISMKLYVISWSTLLDLLACLINSVFNLGIADRDIKLQLIRRNSHVKSSRIHQLLMGYEKTLLIENLREKRNNLVHRGKIPDEEVEQILVERNEIDSRRYSFFQKNPISETEHKKDLSLLQERLAGLAKKKQDEWRKHHQQTIAMLSTISGELMLKTVELYKKQVI
jgi:Cthe_2314-like HEPN